MRRSPGRASVLPSVTTRTTPPRAQRTVSNRRPGAKLGISSRWLDAALIGSIFREIRFDPLEQTLMIGLGRSADRRSLIGDRNCGVSRIGQPLRGT
jgi:hypothetical protein